MKKYCIISLAAALTLVGLSCTKEPETIDISTLQTGQEVILEATIASSDPETKTVRQSNGAVFWSPKDSISLFYGSGDNGGNKFTAVCTEPSAVSNFTGTIGVITGGGEITMDQIYFWGVYPYSSTTACSGGSIYYNLPSRQVSAAGSFSNGQFPTMGRSHELQISFYNICGGIRFTVANENIMSVTFRNIDGGSIAGRLCVTPDSNGLPVVSSISNGSDTIEVTPEDGNAFIPGVDYYVVIPPVTMSSSLEVTYKTLTTKATKTFTSSISISRSVFSGLTAQDNGLTFELRDDAYVPFEDANFKAYCVENFDKDGDGEVSIVEAQNVTSMDFDTKGMENLEGIGYFNNLITLTCKLIYTNSSKGSNGLWHFYDSNNVEVYGLDSLDVSNNTALTSLDCSSNQLISLNLSNNTALTYLDCRYNQLTRLDVSNNSSLAYMNCRFNQLTNLDVSDNSSLTELNCSNNQLMCLDVSNNLALETLVCYVNRLTSLDLSNNISLTELDCSINQLTSLDVSNNIALTELHCDQNQLTSLDISKNIALTELDCSDNQLTSLDISKNIALAELICFANQLSSLDVSNNTALTYLECSNTQMTNLDVSNNTALTYLMCQNTQLTNLDVSDNSSLIELNCSNNRLTNLDVSKNAALQSLTCYSDLLTNLDISQNTSLKSLRCYSNQLTSLDISQNTALTYLDCYNNQLTNLDISKNSELKFMTCSPMNDYGGNNLLNYLYIYDGQHITGVTHSRKASKIPDATEIVIAGIPQVVNLGLSVKWASINLGADTPWESGGYYAWGELTPKSASECNYANYKYAENNGGWKFAKYCTNSNRGTVDNKTRLELADDAAYAELGGNWRIPTKDDWNELVANCTFTYTTMNGIPGYEVRSNKTGYTSNYIFMPLAGQYYSSSHYYEDNMGVYWSSDLVTNDDTGGYVMEVIAPNSSYYWGHLDWHSGPRESGCTVRPVCN